MGETLQEVILQAQEQGRLTCGVHDCAHQLEIDPYKVMLCVLPAETVNPDDVSTHIHHMLIEAFCREYDIRLIKVENLTKLSGMVQARANTPDNTVKASRMSSDVSCLIVQYTEGLRSEEDEKVAEFCKDSIYADTSETCLIALPD